MLHSITSGTAADHILVGSISREAEILNALRRKLPNVKALTVRIVADVRIHFERSVMWSNQPQGGAAGPAGAQQVPGRLGRMEVVIVAHLRVPGTCASSLLATYVN